MYYVLFVKYEYVLYANGKSKLTCLCIVSYCILWQWNKRKMEILSLLAHQKGCWDKWFVKYAGMFVYVGAFVFPAGNSSQLWHACFEEWTLV